MGKNYTIVLADDNIHIRGFLRRELSRPDYRILEAATHLQLFSLLKDAAIHVDLIVLDPYIPYLNGVTMIKRLHEIKPGLPVILYTYMTECRNLPIIQETAGFIEKKGDIRELQDRITALLHGPN